ncbi:ATP-binding protein [Prolixibacter sp. SD074]|uniref:sensor histidine kinase n=1 Tax=Prolixibacter sp. SD074 TaxID=2652391 RepID=UPI00127FEDF6|nr:ATP-binding protein [Prolixibacter sp. SD074]GET29676.1 two-component sensor histidine kinase [Prolixibacter sp. SD074]
MFTKDSFQRKLFVYYFSLFVVFTMSILIYQYQREKDYRKGQLDASLESYTNLTDQYIRHEGIYSSSNFAKLDSLKALIPTDEVRITVINHDGKVLYDSSVKDYTHMENHLHRPELQKSIYSDFGANLRKSATTGKNYYYFARFYQDYFVRAAAVYNMQIRHFLKAEKTFIIFILFLFFVIWFVLRLVSRRMGDSIYKLKDFAVTIRRGGIYDRNIQFPDDELGVISHEIIKLYKQLRRTKDELTQEKEKLFSHLFVLNEGVAFFSSGKKTLLSNNHFIHFINIISEESTISAEQVFQVKAFETINQFLGETLKSETEYFLHDLPRMELNLQVAGRYFHVQCIVFQDKTFEIIITDNTKLARQRLMKQQMTSNIAHELKTPIASARGYLETILESPDLDPEKQRHFIEKANGQVNRLTKLVGDIALLNKIEEAGEYYAIEKVTVGKLISEVVDSFQTMISRKSVVVEVDVEYDLVIKGNYSLVFSIFQNLMENALNYAGENITITIKHYLEDDKFHYFAFSDNGIGIAEEHLSRLFERFYRIDTGRSRKLGGTGLGLAIVKHAVVYQKGEITVRNRKEGGLEFLFSLPRFIEKK